MASCATSKLYSAEHRAPRMHAQQQLFSRLNSDGCMYVQPCSGATAEVYRTRWCTTLETVFLAACAIQTEANELTLKPAHPDVVDYVAS